MLAPVRAHTARDAIRSHLELPKALSGWRSLGDGRSTDTFNQDHSRKLEKGVTIQLQRFAVFGLHGKFDVDIPIMDNRLILVGVNGLGKTTVVNLIYFLITEQWPKLIEADFERIEVTVNREPIILRRESVELRVAAGRRHRKLFTARISNSGFSRELINRLTNHSSFDHLLSASKSSTERLSKEMARELRIPFNYMQRIVSDLRDFDAPDLFTAIEDDPAMIQFSEAIRASGGAQTIYLPTYRRIEQDLKAIFSDLNDEDLRRITSRTEDSPLGANGNVEIVNFGMQDVEEKISSELMSIRERTRGQLSSLTSQYLIDIIRNRADSISLEIFDKINDADVSAVLNRVEDNSLSPTDKEEVKAAIGRIKAGKQGDVRDKYLAYYFSRVMDIYINLYESEEGIRKLSETCNRYFEGKRLTYDDTTFSASISDTDGGPLDWRMLSSGEKQVASLFTHLFLSRLDSHAVIIDEPELSLSVPWQKTLLPDILASQKCEMLIAVTHSPFVYANELDKYAVDLALCVSRKASVSQ
ncbi:AAA family ATPase [Stenotrophomonas hibiscicola]